MTDTKKPADPETGCAPLNRPMAETVSLELVWAAAFTVARLVGGYSAAASAREADELVEELLVTHPRGGR
jgi:hypothetical protein